MPAPTNISFATAIDLGTLPASVTQTVRSGGVNYTVFYKFTAADTGVIGVLGQGVPFSVVVGEYRPRVAVYDANHDPYLSMNFVNQPMQGPVTAGAVYYLECSTDDGNTPTTAVLSLSVLPAPALIAPVGSIAVNDDATGLPLALLSSTDGTVRRFVYPFPSGEAGVVLPNGTLLLEDNDDNVLAVYNGLLQRTAASTSYPSAGSVVISSDQVDTFYVGQSGLGLTPASVTTLSTAGVFGPTTWTLPIAGLYAMAPNLAETILYYSDSLANGNIKRWDLVNNVALTTFVAVANYWITDILNLGDGTFLVAFQKNGTPHDFKVIRYDAAAVILNTYNYGSISTFDTNNRLAHAIDDPTSFWVWIHLTTGFSRFINVKVSDGSAIASMDAAAFEACGYEPTATAFPARFGHSFSCPFWITRTLSAAPTSYDTTTEPIRRLRRFPLGYANDARITIHEFQALVQPGVGTATGQGSDPHLMFRLSRNGGLTWGPERLLSPGKQGEYQWRARTTRLGQARHPYGEITTSDPVPWQLIMGLWDFSVEPD